MSDRQSVAPVPPLRSTGAFVWIGLALAACDAPIPGTRGPELDLGEETVRLERGVEIRDVAVGGPRGGFEPETVVADAGDVVRFTAADAIIHDVAFQPEGLPQGALEFLERSAQLRSPPLVSRGAAWVVSLDGAPPGRYLFQCTIHGRHGVLRVRAS